MNDEQDPGFQEFKALVTAHVAPLAEIAKPYLRKLRSKDQEKLIWLALRSTYVQMLNANPEGLTIFALWPARVKASWEYVRSNPAPKTIDRYQGEMTLEQMVREARRYRPLCDTE